MCPHYEIQIFLSDIFRFHNKRTLLVLQVRIASSIIGGGGGGSDIRVHTP